MKVCLDTCAYVALLGGRTTLQDFLESSTLILMPTIVLGEIYRGIEGSTRQEKNFSMLENFLHLPGVRIQDINQDIARRYAKVVHSLKKVGTPIPINDVWIAASALETGCRLVTYDRHFSSISGLIVENP